MRLLLTSSRCSWHTLAHLITLHPHNAWVGERTRIEIDRCPCTKTLNCGKAKQQTRCKVNIETAFCTLPDTRNVASSAGVAFSYL
jgi:hypothetical protein